MNPVKENNNIDSEFSEIDWPTGPNMRAIALLNGSGDVKCAWDCTDALDCERAAKVFDELRRTGHMMFLTGGGAGGGGGQRDKLDPERSHVAVRAAQGG